MSGEPSNHDILAAVSSLHGDVKVALDRTVRLDQKTNMLEDRVNGHGIAIATAKGSAAAFGSLAGIISALGLSWLRSKGG